MYSVLADPKYAKATASILNRYCFQLLQQLLDSICMTHSSGDIEMGMQDSDHEMIRYAEFKNAALHLGIHTYSFVMHFCEI